MNLLVDRRRGVRNRPPPQALPAAPGPAARGNSDRRRRSYRQVWIDDRTVLFQGGWLLRPSIFNTRGLPMCLVPIQPSIHQLLTRTATGARAAATASTGGTMNTHHRHFNGVKSARELVALTVVIHRWQRDHLLALAREQGCTLSAVLRALLDPVLGPAPEEEARGESDKQSQEEPDEPVTGRSIRLDPHHREMLAVLADRRALPITALLGAIVDAWLQANSDAGD